MAQNYCKKNCLVLVLSTVPKAFVHQNRMWAIWDSVKILALIEDSTGVKSADFEFTARNKDLLQFVSSLDIIYYEIIDSSESSQKINLFPKLCMYKYCNRKIWIKRIESNTRAENWNFRQFLLENWNENHV